MNQSHRRGESPLRDRLTVEASAPFAAQLPDLIRGIFYAGWNPSAVPEMYDAEAYAARFAREAIIARFVTR